MKYLVGFIYKNRSDLLETALHSIRPWWENVIIINGSNDRTLRLPLDIHVHVYTPSTPLTFSQSMNYLIKLAEEQSCETVLYMHTDAEAHPNTTHSFLDAVQELLRTKRRWGVAYTSEFTIFALNMIAVKEIGLWDPILQVYHSDMDYFYRMRLRGFEMVPIPLPITHHNGGNSTIKSDPELMFLAMASGIICTGYYEAKWGGIPNQELFITPFNLSD
ncbi:glycosyltransferase family 2 protein [Paenibacillus guangzhouensis]|uniref:glycosyltransferase family 2 protein n=1 Tax=Paenibacillus guangzhouensis TaxID=1473112 RepID=UPI00187BC20F|nr:glycosyltransferase [Paenibacillus guangzhouensis]